MTYHGVPQPQRSQGGSGLGIGALAVGLGCGLPVVIGAVLTALVAIIVVVAIVIAIGSAPSGTGAPDPVPDPVPTVAEVHYMHERPGYEEFEAHVEGTHEEYAAMAADGTIPIATPARTSPPSSAWRSCTTPRC